MEKNTGKKDSAIQITAGSKVKFHYTGRFESGEIFDSSDGREPLQFEAGAGGIIPGLEKNMVGMKVGEKKHVEVSPDEAYGERNEELIREIPKGPVPEGMKIEEGTMLYLKTPDGQPFPAVVKEVKEDTFVIDFNHPMAGKKLLFDVEIVEIS